MTTARGHARTTADGEGTQSIPVQWKFESQWALITLCVPEFRWRNKITRSETWLWVSKQRGHQTREGYKYFQCCALPPTHFVRGGWVDWGMIGLGVNFFIWLSVVTPPTVQDCHPGSHGRGELFIYSNFHYACLRPLLHLTSQPLHLSRLLGTFSV